MGTENKYYRWVKASERLPDDMDDHFIRWRHSLTDKNDWELLYGNRGLMVSPILFNLEWLEEASPAPPSEIGKLIWKAREIHPLEPFISYMNNPKYKYTEEELISDYMTNK